MSNVADRVSVVVPWWDHADLLTLWPANLRNLAGCQVIFVDNGSAPTNRDSIYHFCQTYGVELIRNEVNRGFSAANNQGIARATGTHVLHLNNDVEIVASNVATILREAAGTGISGPPGPSNILYEPYLEGWAVCAHRENLLRLGGWGEDYTIGFWEDVDLSRRFAQASLQVRAIKDFDRLIRHLEHATVNDGRIDPTSVGIQNRQVYLRKYFSIHPKILIDALVFQTSSEPIKLAWTAILKEWSTMPIAKHLVILNRAETAPRFPGLRYRAAGGFDPSNREFDSTHLQLVYDEEDADAFFSTMDTQPTKIERIPLPQVGNAESIADLILAAVTKESR